MKKEYLKEIIAIKNETIKEQDETIQLYRQQSELLKALLEDTEDRLEAITAALKAYL